MFGKFRARRRFGQYGQWAFGVLRFKDARATLGSTAQCGGNPQQVSLVFLAVGIWRSSSLPRSPRFWEPLRALARFFTIVTAALGVRATQCASELAFNLELPDVDLEGGDGSVVLPRVVLLRVLATQTARPICIALELARRRGTARRTRVALEVACRQRSVLELVVRGRGR